MEANEANKATDPGVATHGRLSRKAEHRALGEESLDTRQRTSLV